MAMPRGIPNSNEINTATTTIPRVSIATSHNPKTPMLKTRMPGSRVLYRFLVRRQEINVTNKIQPHQGIHFKTYSICISILNTRLDMVSKNGPHDATIHFTRASMYGARLYSHASGNIVVTSQKAPAREPLLHLAGKKA